MLFNEKKTKLEDTSLKYLQKISEIYKSTKKEYKKCNILVIGKTGVGKTTLVNSIFGEELAKTGTGKPITKNITKYSNENYNVNIYDTPGLEIYGSKNEKIKIDIDRLIYCENLTNQSTNIDIVWYCIHHGSSRYEQSEDDWLKEINSKNIPIILILTQALNPKRSNFLKILKSENIPVNRIIPILAKPFPIDDNYTIQSYGLDDLVKTTVSLLKNSQKISFISNQKINSNIKIDEANKYLENYINNSDLINSKNKFTDLLIKLISHLVTIMGIPPDVVLPISLIILREIIPKYKSLDDIDNAINDAESWASNNHSTIMKILQGIGKALIDGLKSEHESNLLQEKIISEITKTKDNLGIQSDGLISLGKEQDVHKLQTSEKLQHHINDLQIYINALKEKYVRLHEELKVEGQEFRPDVTMSRRDIIYKKILDIEKEIKFAEQEIKLVENKIDQAIN